MIIFKSSVNKINNKNNRKNNAALNSFDTSNVSFTSGLSKVVSVSPVDTFIKTDLNIAELNNKFKGFILSDDDLKILKFLKQKCIYDHRDEQLKVNVSTSLVAQNTNLDEHKVKDTFIKLIKYNKDNPLIKMDSTSNKITFSITPELHEILTGKKLLRKGRIEFESKHLHQNDLLRSILKKSEEKEGIETIDDGNIITVKFNNSDVGSLSSLIEKIAKLKIPAKLLIPPENKKCFTVPDGIKTQYIVYEEDYNDIISIPLASELNLSTEKQAIIELLYNQQYYDSEKLLNQSELYRFLGVITKDKLKSAKRLFSFGKAVPVRDSRLVKNALYELILDDIVRETRINKSSDTYYVLNPKFYESLKNKTKFEIGI